MPSSQSRPEFNPQRSTRVLTDLFLERGIPVHIHSDNGSEFTAKKVREYFSRLEVKPLFIEPGSP